MNGMIMCIIVPSGLLMEMLMALIFGLKPKVMGILFTKDLLKLKVVTPVFLEHAASKPKIISFYAKKARGAMARFVMQNKITATTELMEFDSGGYAYEPALSDEQTLYFTR